LPKGSLQARAIKELAIATGENYQLQTNKVMLGNMLFLAFFPRCSYKASDLPHKSQKACSRHSIYDKDDRSAQHAREDDEKQAQNESGKQGPIFCEHN
jgi:hypothetical protein